MTARVLLAEAAFDPAAALADFTRDGSGDDGAIASFSGHMRSTAKDGTALIAMHLESYRGVTIASMQAIADDALARFAISRAMVIHRAGRIESGEAVVFVATAAAHRRASFDAADYLMDRLKSEAVFWKWEESATGKRWIEPTDRDRDDLARWTPAQDHTDARN